MYEKSRSVINANGVSRFLSNYLSRVPKSDSLHLTEWRKNGKIYIAVVCECGNRKMTIHELGLRCHECGLLHDHIAYEKMRKQAVFKGETLAKSSVKYLQDQKLKPVRNRFMWIPSLRWVVTRDLLRQMKFKKRIA